MAHGTHDYDADPRNANVKINLNGALVPRQEAVVSVFDSGFVLGDGVWEGLRVHGGVIVFLGRHLRRLYEGAKALDITMPITREKMAERLYETIDANGMTEGGHIRLMVTRGEKSTPYQDPRVTIGEPTIVIVPEFKSPLKETLDEGISLFTVHVRRGYPDVQDQKINSHSKLNCILACIQATKAGADEALMLDPHGFVATCNSTHFFIVKGEEIWTSTGQFCLGGVTRGLVIEAAREIGVQARQKNFSLTDVYSADEAFVTGTYAGLVPVHSIDGRTIGVDEGSPSLPGPMVQRLRTAYKNRIKQAIAGGRGL